MRIMTLHNDFHRLASLGIIGYDLDQILVSNLSNFLRKSIHNVEPTFRESLGIHGRQKHRPTFRDGNEINDQPLLCIRLFITTKKHTLQPPSTLNGFQYPLYISFFILQKRVLNELYTVRDIARDGIVGGICKCHGIVWIPCEVK